MQFNIEKCKVMHLGYNNPCFEYTIGDEKLMMTKSEKDLGIVIHSTLKPAAHIANCVTKATQMLWMIQIIITYKKTREYYCLCIKVLLDHIWNMLCKSDHHIN